MNSNPKLNILTVSQVCVSFNWLHGAFPPTECMVAFQLQSPSQLLTWRPLLGGIDRTFSAGQWHLSLAGGGGWDSIWGRRTVTMGGEVPLKVLLVSHWINTEISPIYTSAFVANRTHRNLQQWSTFSLPVLVIFFLTFFFSLCMNWISIHSEQTNWARDCDDSLGVTQHWRDSTLMETCSGWGSKVISPFGIAETWAFIDLTLM